MRGGAYMRDTLVIPLHKWYYCICIPWDQSR